MKHGRRILATSLTLLAVLGLTSCQTTSSNLTQRLAPATTRDASATMRPGQSREAGSDPKKLANGERRFSSGDHEKPNKEEPFRSVSDVQLTSARRGGPLPSMVGSNLLVRTTAYSHKEADSLPYGRLNAAGGVLQYGSTIRSAAADWSRFPLGTRFRIKGQPYEYVVDDYGSALAGTNTIDLYKPTIAAMNEWGCRRVPIQIIEWGCFHKSRKILDSRKHVDHADHVRQMLRDIESRYTGRISTAGSFPVRENSEVSI